MEEKLVSFDELKELKNQNAKAILDFGWWVSPEINKYIYRIPVK